LKKKNKAPLWKFYTLTVITPKRFVPPDSPSATLYHPSLKSAEADFKRPLLEKRRGVPSFVAKMICLLSSNCNGQPYFIALSHFFGAKK
jgi:hypothetical protein